MAGIVGSGAYLSGGDSVGIRWVSQVKLVVELDEDNREQIYVPYL